MGAHQRPEGGELDEESTDDDEQHADSSDDAEAGGRPVARSTAPASQAALDDQAADSRAAAQAAALGSGGGAPSSKKGMLDMLSKARKEGTIQEPHAATEKPNFKKEKIQTLGRWGTGGVGVTPEAEAMLAQKKQQKKGFLGLGKSSRTIQVVSDKDRPAAPAAAPADEGPTEDEQAEAAEVVAEESGVAPVRRENAVHGWVFKRGGVKSKAYRKRYCVYEPLTRRFTYYDSEHAAKEDTRRKGRVRVTQAGVITKAGARSRIERRMSNATAAPTLSGGIEGAIAAAVDNAGEGGKHGPKYEFKFNTDLEQDGAKILARARVFEVYVEKATDLRVWLEAMPHWGSELTMGWLHKRKHGSKKNSFDRRCGRLIARRPSRARVYGPAAPSAYHRLAPPHTLFTPALCLARAPLPPFSGMLSTILSPRYSRTSSTSVMRR